MTRRMEGSPGEHIRKAVWNALTLATKSGETVTFDFNGTEHRVEPDDTYDTAKARAEATLGHPILMADEEAKQARESLAKSARESAEAIASAGVPTEKEMREADVPWPKTAEELSAYIAGLVNRPHDYGTCVYAMSMAATASFYYAAHVVGSTGFQASCADMDILRRTRGLKHGFRLLDYGNLLYPQYCDAEHFPGWRDLMGDPDIRKRLADDAARLLTEASEHTHPNVLAHWRSLVEVD